MPFFCSHSNESHNQHNQFVFAHFRIKQNVSPIFFSLDKKQTNHDRNPRAVSLLCVDVVVVESGDSDAF